MMKLCSKLIQTFPPSNCKCPRRRWMSSVDKIKAINDKETIDKDGIDNILSFSIDTQFVTFGRNVGADVSPPIHFSTTFERDDNLELQGFNYSRLGSPNRQQLEQNFTQLETGVESFAFSSGMQTVFSLLSACPNSHVLLPDDLYHGVSMLLSHVFTAWGTTYEKTDMTNHQTLKQKLQEVTEQSGKRIILWMETPSNPTCKVTDIATIAQFARVLVGSPERLCIVVDSTWATPYLVRPLELGADFVMHSMTKYIGGHSDMLGGILVAGNTAAANALLPILRTVHQIGGGVCGPFEAWMALRGLRTLPVRMRQHCENAMAVAEFLEGHPCVEKVFYPGLLRHPQHKLAEQQMGGKYGGMVSFMVKSRDPSSAAEALKVVKGVRLFRRATSLGGTESLIEHRATAEGVHGSSPPNLLRLSVGLEDIGDLLADLESALEICRT